MAQTLKKLPAVWDTQLPWRRTWQPMPVSLTGESHGQRSLAGYSPWVTESREWLSNEATATWIYICNLWVIFFPGGSDGKASAWDRTWVRKFPWKGKQQPAPVPLPGKFHGQRSPVGYSPWGCRESDTAKQLHFHFLLDYIFYIFFNIFYIIFCIWGGAVCFCSIHTRLNPK